MSDPVFDPDEFYADADRRRRERSARRSRRPARPPARVRASGSTRLAQLTRRVTNDELRHLVAFPAGRVLVWAVAAIAAATVIGLVVLWPGGAADRGTPQPFGDSQRVEVTGVRTTQCPGPVPQDCRQILIGVDGRTERISLGPVTAVPDIARGDHVRVSRVHYPAGAAPPAAGERYQFLDVDRQGSLLTMLAALGVLAVALLWWRGLLAIVGVGLSLLLLLLFVIPALLGGEPALLVALVGALAVMFVTLVLTSGIGAQTLAAALGISATLLLTALLATAFIALTHLDGRSDDVSLYLSQQNESLSLTGVVLAGMIIGALGVLADTAVTQASAVMALRRANPALSAAGLYRGAFAVGRDHLSATIHTLVLAYAGASLPTLLAMRASGLPLADAFNSQSVAEPVVATAIGCAALIAAVPLTTGLASLLIVRVPADALPHGHGHAH